jgi:hypothetical protein
MRTRRLPFVFGIAAIGVLLPLAVVLFRPAHDSKLDPYRSELTRLERWKAHARPGSAQAFKLQQKIDRIEAYAEGKPQFDNPGEFARLLAEMKIPSDRTAPEYALGYQKRELDSALGRRAGKASEILPWVSRGPGNVGGRARGIVVDPDDPTEQTWFIGSVGGGVWKTTNAGAGWTWLTADFPVLSTSAIAMAPSNHDVLYVGTGESFYNVDTINGNGILRSLDRGLTWTHLASTVDDPAFNNIARILVDPADEDVVIVAATRGRYKEFLNQRSSIFKSTDGGANWIEVFASTAIGSLSRVKKLQQLVADPTDFNILYATVDEAGILKSTNRGDTWTFINTGITDFTGRFEMAVSPVDHNRLYAAAEGAAHSELWISSNAGASWSRTTASGSEPNWLGAQGWYDNTIVCHPTDPNIVYVGGIRLWRLTLSGTSRSATNLNAPVHVDHHGLAVVDAPGGGWRLLNTSDGGVAVSTTTDAGFSQVIDGLVTTQFYGIDKRPGGSAYVGGTQDNGTWLSPLDPDALAGWQSVIGGDGYETSWHFDDPLKIIGGYQYNGLERSLDGGQTWTSAVTSVSPPGTIDTGSANAPFITKIAKTPANPERLFAVGRRGVWRSNDFGGTWSLSSIASGDWGAISSFHCVRISRADPNVIYGGARMDGSGKMHRSIDGGVTFTMMPNYTTVAMGGISGLATHPTDPNTAYVLFGFAERPKILRTVNGGTTWQDITGFESSPVSTNGFPDVAVYDLVVFSNDTNKLWAATEIGIVESLDGGATWAIADNGLPHVAVWLLTEVEDEIVAGTHGRGVWSVTMPDLIAGKTFKPLIDQLYQGPDGFLSVELNLRTEYDSTQVWVDGVHSSTLPANTARQHEVVQIPVIAAGTKSVFARAYAGGNPYDSVTRSVSVYQPKPPVFVYVNDFETPNDDFAGSLLDIGTESGFTGSAIHSPHPYDDSTNPITILTVPIRVAQSNALIEFDELALVEPGDSGTVFGDPNFWDYVIVEGSTDGLTWVPLAPGWDCRAYPEWETAYNTNSPSPTLLRRRSINLLDTFSWNETILIRFRLYADSAVNGWGWIVDNLEIQVGSTTAAPNGAPPVALALQQNVPNPLRTGTAIRFTLPSSGKVNLRIFDARGRLVRSLLSENRNAGAHEIRWDGRDSGGAEVAGGIYFYRLEAGDKVLRRKLTVLH